MKNKRYQSLDAIRFIAFFKVFLLHLPEGIHTPFFNFIKQGGGTGVSIFFVLSGFLISNILIREKLKKGSINPRKFFWRRAFRIWPLYFLGVAIAFAGILFTSHFNISESSGYMPKPIYSMLFLENYKSIIEGTSPRGVPLQVFWSLCIEEHFYILWLVLFLILPLKHIVKTLISIWIISISSRFLTLIFLPQYQINGAELITSLDYFVVGGLIASYINGLIPQFIKQAKYKHKLFIFVITSFYIVFQHLWFESLGVFGITVSAIIYGLCIWASVMPGDSRLEIKDNAIISKLGVISYGLYVFHTPIIMVLRKAFETINFNYNESLGLVVFFVLSLLITIFISWMSYKFFETKFINLREKLWS